MDSCTPSSAWVGLIALDGASVAYSFEVLVLQLFNIRERRRRIRFFKAIMAFSMGLKITLFLVITNSLSLTSCQVLGKIADSSYHVALIFGNAVLLDRVTCIVPVHLTRRFVIAHFLILFVRFVLGVVNEAFLTIGVSPDGRGGCTYVEPEVLGPLFTIYDGATDLYVTVAVLTILSLHINNVKRDNDFLTNTGMYIAVALTNVLRTFFLMASNVLSATLIILNTQPVVTQMVWAIADILIVMLIGHDKDIAVVIKDLYALRKLPAPLLPYSQE